MSTKFEHIVFFSVVGIHAGVLRPAMFWTRICGHTSFVYCRFLKWFFLQFRNAYPVFVRLMSTCCKK